ncbi:MAG: adenine deaminase, partial [Clostridia bacterium]|nr:adenine deaminase [Clostridia bacterium]
MCYNVIYTGGKRMIKQRIEAAAGRIKADTVLKNGNFVNVFTGEICTGDIAVYENRIVGIGNYQGETEIDITGMTVLPGYIDGHVHIESSQLSPEEFASLIVPRGTTTIIADPHEITNVCGMNGVDYIVKASQNVPLDVKVQLPSCVPATPFETSGAVLSGKDIEENIVREDVHGLGEFMNYPGVIYTDEDVLKKLSAAHEIGKVIDGHAPTVSGQELNAYLCGGISTDHECITPEEIEEKIAKGLYCHLRHGSSTRNLVTNAKSVTEKNLRRFLICTDDRHAADLMEKGHIDDALRQLVKSGFNPVWAVIIATLNNAECYGLKWKGAVAPNYIADLVVVDNITDFNAKYVFKDGKLVAKDGKALFDTSKRYLPENVLNTVRLRKMTADDFTLTLRGKKAKVMQIIPDNVATKCVVREVQSENGDVKVKGTNLLKLAVVERHHGTGNIGKGLLEGYGFTGCALGITIAHDSHNVILLGDNNEDMALAANRLQEIGGGMVIAHDGKCESVTLDIGGLMSSKDAKTLESQSRNLIEKAYSMGVDRNLEAFMSLAFLSLAVIPDIKLLDTGLF